MEGRRAGKAEDMRVPPPTAAPARRTWTAAAARLLAVVLLIGTVSPALAQEASAPARTDSLPPLPAVLVLYGDTLRVDQPAPPLAPPPGAARLSLEEAIRLALRQSPGLGISALEAERARNDVTLGNAGFLPTVDAEVSASGNRSSIGPGGFGGQDPNSPNAGGGSGGDVREVSQTFTGLSAAYTVFDGGQRRATLRRLRAEALRAASDADADAEALAYAVTAAYLDVLRLQALAAALEEAVRVSEDRLRIEAGRVQIGVGADIDAARALADLNADRAALLRQAAGLAAARADLGGLLALPNPGAVAATDRLTLGPPADLDALAALLDRSPQVRALQAGEVAAAQALREVRAAYWPTVGTTAGVGVGTFAFSFAPSVPEAPGLDLRYGVTARLPLFDGGERARRRENAQLRLRQAELATADLLADLRADAARLQAAARGYRALAALETQNVAIARQNVDVALAQYRLGFTTPVDLRLVQLAAVEAESRLVDAVYLARTAETELQLVAGTLLPRQIAAE